MRWSEINLNRDIWAIPESRTKNARAHMVPLSAQAKAVVESQPRRPGRDLVFGIGKGGFSGWGRCKERSDRRSGLSDWRLHDLRRTCVTGMAEIGIQPHVIEAVVNHISGHKGGVAGIYNRATYFDEKKAALQRWGDHLARVVGEGTVPVVVPLHRGR